MNVGQHFDDERLERERKDGQNGANEAERWQTGGQQPERVADQLANHQIFGDTLFRFSHH